MMPDDPEPQKIPLIFYRTEAGSEPVREWLKGLPEAERQAIGKDLLRAPRGTARFYQEDAGNAG
jgi:hypothetical protein